MWEDKRNLKGGRWVYAAQKTHSLSLDKQWMEMVRQLLGVRTQGFPLTMLLRLQPLLTPSTSLFALK